MVSEEEFTEAQLDVLRELPGSRDEIAESLGISRRAVRGRMDNMEEETDAYFERDRENVWSWAGDDELDAVISRADTEPESDPGGELELTGREAQVVDLLAREGGESTQGLAAALGVEPDTAWDYIDSLRGKDVTVEYDPSAKVYFLGDGQAKVRRVATKHTGTKTREANEFATEMETAILRRLKAKEPLRSTPSHHPGNEDVVVHMTDTHMGDVVEDETGREIYNPEICEALVEHYTEKVLDLTGMMESVTEFDTLHLLWGGDMLTNENIYDGQAFDIRQMLADQMASTVDVLTWQAKTFAEHFDAVQIVAQPGNHGKTRASGVSKQANMDLLAYRWVEDRLAEANCDNVRFLQSEATNFRNFEMRDGRWRGHLRHGQDSLQHVDATSSSQSTWRGWWIKHEFDVGYRGHYHVGKREPIMGQWDVIESPSMKPGGEFAEKIGQPDPHVCRKLGTVHGVSDSRPKTWEYEVDDRDLDLSL